MTYEMTGAVPIYAWRVEVPDGPILLRVGGSTRILTVAGSLWGYGAEWVTGLTDGVQPVVGTVTHALASAIEGELGAGTAWHFLSEGDPLCHLRTVYLAPATELEFDSVTQANSFGFSTKIVQAQMIGGAATGFVCDLDSAGYWAPKRGLGSHSYRPHLRARHSTASYGAGLSVAQWGPSWQELHAIHRDVKRGMIYGSDRADAAYSVPADVAQGARHNLFERMLDAMRAGQEIRLWRRQPFGAAASLRANNAAELAQPAPRETMQGQCETLALSWQWLNYPEGA